MIAATEPGPGLIVPGLVGGIRLFAPLRRGERAPGREEGRDDHEPAGGGVEEEVVAGRDDREEHERRIGGAEQAHPAAAASA